MAVDLKTQKYDRQLRLWAANGQAALEGAKVCLINGTATGTEILKNLILPGIGSFTIVDGSTVADSDLGNNFFLDASSLGQSRAVKTMELLAELNDDARGTAVDRDPAQLIDTDPSFFHQFTMIVATQLDELHVARLARIAWEAGIPFMVVRVSGFLGYLRIVTREHTVIETHPESLTDLRLDCPFPALHDFAASFDLDSLDSLDHGHVPFVVVLLKYLDQWRTEHNGQLPSTYAEKNAFKALLRSGARSYDEENFEEALANVWRACTVTRVPDDVRLILLDPACDNLTAESSSFWIVARAVREFVANEGQGLLPLSGALPDMKADTKGYIDMQNIYRRKAQEDIAAVHAHVESIITTIGLPPNSIPMAEIEAFAKHSAFLKVIRHRNLEEEFNAPRADAIAKWLADSEPVSNIVHYILFRAAERFREQHGRYPGADDGADLEADTVLLKRAAAEMLAAWGVPGAEQVEERVADFASDFVRFGSSELANIAALVGGLVSQEIIKLITRQYIPIDNTVIFDGTRAMSSTFQL